MENRDRFVVVSVFKIIRNYKNYHLKMTPLFRMFINDMLLTATVKDFNVEYLKLKKAEMSILNDILAKKNRHLISDSQ
jgi:hypothetical protein